MKKYRRKKWLRIIVFVLISIGLLSFLLLIPFIINKIYDLNPPNAFFNIDIEKGDILDYYAQLLSLIATIILGVIAVVQTYRSQKKSDEINELQLSIARRELAVAEKQYSEAQHRKIFFLLNLRLKLLVIMVTILNWGLKSEMFQIQWFVHLRYLTLKYIKIIYWLNQYKNGK